MNNFYKTCKYYFENAALQWTVDGDYLLLFRRKKEKRQKTKELLFEAASTMDGFYA